MIIQATRHTNLARPPSSPSTAPGLGLDMGASSDDIVVIRLGQKKGDPSVVTVNCPDQLGLGCDLARVIFEFGLTVVRGDLSTDGRWCFLIFWVTPRLGSPRPIKWALLKKRLVASCPSSTVPLLLPLIPKQRSKEVYVLQARSSDRAGLLNDIALTLWELELTIHKVKVATTPEGKAVDFFYLTDTKYDSAVERDMLSNRRRQDEVCARVRTVLAESGSYCQIELAGREWGGIECSPASSLPPSLAEDLFNEGKEMGSDMGSMGPHGSILPNVSVTLDNSLSPGHTLLQISCKDRKGLLYDCLRALKDFNIQVAYGRLSTTPRGTLDIDLFILQADGKKIVDPQKQQILCSRLETEIVHPIRMTVIDRGPDTELLVAAPIEVDGRGRPQVLYDITLVLKMLEICIFMADIGRHTIGDRQWEIYRFLLIDTPELCLTSNRTRSYIVERVKNVLIG